MAFIVADRVRETSTTTGTGTFTLSGAVSGYQTFSSAIGNTNTTYYTISNSSANEWEVGLGTVGAGTLARTTILSSSNAGSAVDFSTGTKDVFCTYPAEKTVFTDNTATLTNKTISGASNTLSNIGNSSLTNSAVTIGSTSVSLGATTTTLAGLTSVASGQVNITGQGDLRLEDTTGGEYVALQAPATLAASYTLTLPSDDGTNGQVLTTDGSGNLAWATDAGGDVVGPSSATDNAVSRFDGTTGKLIQNSGVIIDDSNNVSGVVNLTSSGSVTLSGGTANGVAYLNGSKVLTTGSALVFNGTNLGVGVNPTNAKLEVYATTGEVFRADAVGGSFRIVVNQTDTQFQNATSIQSWIAGSEQMRLTSTGLGIGTSSPSAKLDVQATQTVTTTSGGGQLWIGNNSSTGTDVGALLISSQGTRRAQISAGIDGVATNAGYLAFTTRDATTFNERMRIDSSGNVGIGTSSPGAKLDVYNSAAAAVGNEVLRLRYNTSTSNATGDFNFTNSSGTALNKISSICTSGSTVDLGFSVYNSGITEALRLTASGNLGLGVTPSTWGSNWKATQSGLTGALASSGSGSTTPTNLVLGAYNDNTNWKYQYSSVGAARYEMTGANGGSTHAWYISAGGTAGNAISFTQAMTLDASSNLTVGGTIQGLQVFQSSSGADLVLNANGANRDVIIKVNGSEQARFVGSTGNVGIGTSSPSSKLHVYGGSGTNIGIQSSSGVHWRLGDAVGSSDGTFVLYDYTNSQHAWNYVSGASGAHKWFTAGSERMRIDSTGNILVAKAARATITTDNDLSFDMNAASNFQCTPSATGALTFTNITSGQSGYVLLINTGGYAITAAASTKVGSTFLSTVSTAGTYLISYFSTGSAVYCTASGALS